MTHRSSPQPLPGLLPVGKTAMFNPCVLEGEVDHSFFDSDCDDRLADKDGKNMDSFMAKRGSPKRREKLHADETESTKGGSPASTECSIGADSESSYSSSNRRSSLDAPTRLRTKKSERDRRDRKTQVGSARSRDVPASHTEELDDTVTDVSPLSSSLSSRFQSLDLNHAGAEEGKEQLPEESAYSSGLSNIQQDEYSNQDIDESSLSAESKLGGRQIDHYPRGRNRKNYSFTNDEVRAIDCENQRLLRELSRIHYRPSPGSKAGRKTRMASNPPLVRLSHSGLNWQREHQRIERENLALLKRLESVKPTPGLMRSQQLADYQRQAGYPGAHSYPMCYSTTKKERPNTTKPAGSPRKVSFTSYRSRVVSTSTDSSNKPVPRSRTQSAARPEWC